MISPNARKLALPGSGKPHTQKNPCYCVLKAGFSRSDTETELGHKMFLRDQHLEKKGREQEWAEEKLELRCRFHKALTNPAGSLQVVQPVREARPLNPSLIQ